MDLWQLHIFSRVIELGGFGKAARAVNLSQPTVSSHIKDLENHFGCKLVDRLGRQTAPTKGGEILYDFARRILALANEAQSAMSDFLGKPAGSLKIGGSNIPGCYVLPKVIGAFSKLYPDVSISLSIGDTSAVTEDTIAGNVEMGVVGAISPDKRLVQEKLMDDQLSLIVPAGHALAKKKSVTMERLASEPFICREPGSGTRKFFEKTLLKAGHEKTSLNIVAQLGSTEAVREAIKANMGISVMSTRAVAEQLNRKTMYALSIFRLDLSRSFYIIRRRQRTASPLCEYFCDFLKEFANKPASE